MFMEKLKLRLSKEEKLAAVKQKFSDDLEGFARFILRDHMDLPPAEFHKEVYKLITEGNKKVAIAAPRNHAKSTIITLAFILWCALTEKKKFIVIACDTFPQAKMFLEAIKKECEDNELLQELYGNQKTEKWSEADIELKIGCRIMAKGAEMKFRGLKYKQYRPDLVVIDDLENDEMVENKERREKLRRWFSGTLMPAVDKAKGQFVYIGTVLHDDALLYRILSKDYYTDWVTRLYSAVNPDGTALWPERFSVEELEEMKAEAIRNGELDLFMAEYMNNPITDENREFKRGYFKYYTDLPTDDKGQQKPMRITMTVDPAISKKDHADY